MATVEINPLEIVEGLDERCRKCERVHIRDGAWPPYSEWVTKRVIACDVCHGKGYTLTAAGRAMLAFLERWR